MTTSPQVPDSYPRTRGNTLAPMDSNAVLAWLDIATLEELRWFFHEYLDDNGIAPWKGAHQ